MTTIFALFTIISLLVLMLTVMFITKMKISLVTGLISILLAFGLYWYCTIIFVAGTLGMPKPVLYSNLPDEFQLIAKDEYPDKEMMVIWVKVPGTADPVAYKFSYPDEKEKKKFRKAAKDSSKTKQPKKFKRKREFGKIEGYRVIDVKQPSNMMEKQID